MPNGERVGELGRAAEGDLAATWRRGPTSVLKLYLSAVGLVADDDVLVLRRRRRAARSGCVGRLAFSAVDLLLDVVAVGCGVRVLQP